MFQIIVDTSKVIGDAFYAIMDLRLLEFLKVAKQISKGIFFFAEYSTDQSIEQTGLYFSFKFS